MRLKSGTHAGARGILESFDDEKLVVRLEGSGLKIRVASDQITNFSLAARKTWVTEPGRAVGRRKGTKLSDRVSVTFALTGPLGAGPWSGGGRRHREPHGAD